MLCVGHNFLSRVFLHHFYELLLRNVDELKDCRLTLDGNNCFASGLTITETTEEDFSYLIGTA